MAWRQERFRVRDGCSLLVRVCTPETPDPKKTLLVIHGGCEHGGRYSHVLERFAAYGWTSVLSDQRGHGGSDGPRMDVESVDVYLDDLREVARAFCPAKPLVIVGHSFGGMLAARLVQLSQVDQFVIRFSASSGTAATLSPLGPDVRALVMCSPFLGLSLRVPWWKYSLGTLLRWVAPQVRFRTGLDAHNMTRDPDFLARRRADKLIQKSVTVRWFFAALSGVAQAQRDAGRVTCPVLALQGLDDRTVNPAALQAWWPHVPATKKELVEFPGHVHELLFDSDWMSITDRIVHWLEKLD